MNAAWDGTLVFSLLMFPLLVAMIDIVPNVRAARHVPNDSRAERPTEDDFTVLVPIYGSVDYLVNVDYLAAVADRVVLCTTTDESEAFNAALNRIAADNGFRVFRAPVKNASPSAKRRISGSVRDPVVRAASQMVTTPYVVCIDADTISERPLSELVGALKERELDMASVIIEPLKTGRPLAGLQAHEYRMAMRLRRVMPWLISGACHVGKTAAHRDVMAHHSMFFQGNDAELGLLAEAMGYRVGHIRFAVPTAVPDTIKGWARQRFAWSGGEFRLYVVNFRLVRRHPFFFFYGAIVVLAMLPFRWIQIQHPGIWIAVLVAIYTLLVLWINWKHKDRWLILYPVYGAFVSLVLPVIGVVSYAVMALGDHNAGVIDTHARRAA